MQSKKAFYSIKIHCNTQPERDKIEKVYGSFKSILFANFKRMKIFHHKNLSSVAHSGEKCTLAKVFVKLGNEIKG